MEGSEKNITQISVARLPTTSYTTSIGIEASSNTKTSKMMYYEIYEKSATFIDPHGCREPAPTDVTPLPGVAVVLAEHCHGSGKSTPTSAGAAPEQPPAGIEKRPFSMPREES